MFKKIRSLFKSRTLTRADFLGKIIVEHDDFCAKMLHKHSFDTNIKNETFCEIKMFLLMFYQSFLQKNVFNGFTSKQHAFLFYKEHVLFSTIEKEDYGDDFLENWMQERMDFYDKAFQGKIHGSYHKDIEYFFFNKPFCDQKDLITRPIGFGFVGSTRDALKFREFCDKMIVRYMEGLLPMLYHISQNIK